MMAILVRTCGRLSEIENPEKGKAKRTWPETLKSRRASEFRVKNENKT